LKTFKVGWTQGPGIGQVALCGKFGANDFGAWMMEENVVSSGGRHLAWMRANRIIIRAAGYEPRRQPNWLIINLDQAL